MIKQAWFSFIILGVIVGSSAMYSIMYNEPLTDYTYQGIQNYTSILYGLGPSIFDGIVNNIIIVFKELINVITNIVDVIVNIFGWLSNQLAYLINGIVSWLESLGIDLSNLPDVPAGCVYVNGRLECL